ncbi:MAG: TetR family transcriptional regulator [Nitriliruptor sp.]|uniref:TetR/AcrR family transcriptional regulator n=1 Tax=Nitriliruptor sp. TaxID=2448056 RepID=UPI0034A0A09F
MDHDLGLRERKKRETKAALSRAAFELCAERGIDAVTVPDIAASANVSPRTFFNYFSSKEEAIVGGTERAERLVELLAARPVGEPIWDALRAAVVELVAGEPTVRRELVEQARLVSDSPALAQQQVANWLEMERLLAAEVARRAGHAPGDLHPRLLVAAVGAAVRVAIDHWIDTPTDASIDTPLEAVIDEALGVFSAGFHDSSHPCRSADLNRAHGRSPARTSLDVTTPEDHP